MMSDVGAGSRIEPAMGSAPAGAAMADTPPAAPPARPIPVAAERPAASASDQLSRVEDKAARIEEKFARIENLMHRVETAALGLNDVARQSDMDRLSGRVGRLPGFRGLLVTAVVTSLLTAAIVVAIIRFLPGIIGS